MERGAYDFAGAPQRKRIARTLISQIDDQGLQLGVAVDGCGQDG